MRITFSGVYSRLSSLTIARMTGRFSTKPKKPIKPSVIAEKMSAGRHLLVDDRRVDPIADRRSNSETCSLWWIRILYMPPDENLLSRMRNSSTRSKNGLWDEKTLRRRTERWQIRLGCINQKQWRIFKVRLPLCKARSRYPRPRASGRRPTLEKATCVADRENCRRFSYRCASLIRRRITYRVSMRTAEPSSISAASRLIAL